VTPSRHERGTIRVQDTFPGIAAFRSYTCQGRLFEQRARPEHTLLNHGRNVIDQMDAELETVCPKGHPPGECPFERMKLDETIHQSLLLAGAGQRPVLVR
jgi:hypothetical protein